MKIKIVKENAEKIELALKATNGKAGAHTFTTFSQVFDELENFEKFLNRLFSNKKDKSGAILTTESWGPAAAAYNNIAITTRIKILYSNGAYWLVGISRSNQWPSQKPMHIYTLTKEQDICAVENLRKKYQIAISVDTDVYLVPQEFVELV